MTWGEQNSPQEAFTQMDYALERGVNFFDTAELYAIPPKAESYGATETIIGRWLKARGNRDNIVLASKVCGPTVWCPHIRGGRARLDAANIIQACEASLTRLQTDYLDLYQTHWPDRNANFFGKLGYQHDDNETITPIEETLEALSRLVEQGKVRQIGVSNETAWGTMHHLSCAASNPTLPRIATIQNPYNLLNRSFEIGLAEVSCREQVGLLAYSPLAFGMLSGKYLNGARPPQGRLTRFADYNRYTNPQAQAATSAYVALARSHCLNPAQMALAFIHQQPFVNATIIGATTMEQLSSNINSIDITLDAAVLAGIAEIQQQYPNPAP